jgi:hypothetical protein
MPLTRQDEPERDRVVQKLPIATNQYFAARGDVVTMCDQDQQHVFYRGTDGSIQHIFWDGPVNMPFRDSWTERTQAPPAAGNPATLVTGTQQHVFYRAADGSVQHIFWDGPSRQLFRDSWTARTAAPAAAGDPATMRTPDTEQPTQQHVFYRSADGSIQHIFFDVPTNQLLRDDWTDRTHAPGAAGGPATMVTPSSDQPTQQHVFYRAHDGSVQHIFWDAPTNQLFRDSWTERTGAPAAAGDPATMRTPGQQHVFYRAADGSIQHIFFDEPTNQLLHDDWTARTGAPAAAGDPATMLTPSLDQPTQQHVFYRAHDGSVQHIFWDAPTQQLARDSWTQLTGAPGAVSDVATLMTKANSGPSERHVFYRTAVGSIEHLFLEEGTGRLFRDDWTARVHAPAADGKPATMASSNPLPFDFTQWPHVHGTPVFGELGYGAAFLYVWPEKDHLQSFRWLGNRFDVRPTIATTRSGAAVLAPPWKDPTFAQPKFFGQNGMPGGILSLSIDPSRAKSGVLFASVKTCGDGHNWRECSTTLCGTTISDACAKQEPGMLRAFDPISLRELWNDQVDSNPRSRYSFAKFVPPTVARGRVFLATGCNPGAVLVYGTGVAFDTPAGDCTWAPAAHAQGPKPPGAGKRAGTTTHTPRIGSRSYGTIRSVIENLIRDNVPGNLYPIVRDR